MLAKEEFMAKITDIQPQKRNKNRVNLYLDGEYSLALELITVKKLGLKIGNDVSESQLAQATLDTEQTIALEKAMNYIARGRKTSWQMKKYLVDKQYSPAVVQYVMDKMKYYGYIDDKAYAEAYAEQNADTKGARRIKQELLQRGLSVEYAEQFSEQDGELSLTNAERLAARYMRGKIGDVKTLSKLQRYLVSRGYDFDVVNSVVRSYKNVGCNADEYDDTDV